MHIDEIRSSPASRRLFLKRMSVAGLGIAAASLLSGEFGTPGRAFGAAPATTPAGASLSDAQAAFPGIPGNSVLEIVLNFALTLEILEADLYRQALNTITKRPINTPLDSSPSKYKLKVEAGKFFGADQTSAAFTYISEFAFVEAAHRDFLIAAITAAGGTPTKPNPAGYKFPDKQQPVLRYILGDLFPLEETGVRAYLGALPYLGDQLAYAQVAGGIFSTEARHSAAIRYVYGFDQTPEPRPGDNMVVPSYPSPDAFEYYLTPSQVLTAASVYFR